MERADLPLQIAETMLDVADNGMPSVVVALGHAIWLSVTYPIDTELSILMMKNLIDDTPAKSNGATLCSSNGALSC